MYSTSVTESIEDGAADLPFNEHVADPVRAPAA
jgi:hypothetical protein